MGGWALPGDSPPHCCLSQATPPARCSITACWSPAFHLFISSEHVEPHKKLRIECVVCCCKHRAKSAASASWLPEFRIGKLQM